MKKSVLTLIPSEYLPGLGISGLDGLPSEPEIYKAWHGFNNCITGRLLCPKNHLQQFKGNPEE